MAAELAIRKDGETRLLFLRQHFTNGFVLANPQFFGGYPSFRMLVTQLTQPLGPVEAASVIPSNRLQVGLGMRSHQPLLK
jgi:hypothetical protein